MVLYFEKKNHNKKSLEGKFQKKIQTAISGTENTVKTDTEKPSAENLFRAHYFRTKEKQDVNRHQ